VGVIALAALLVPIVARGVSSRWHDDSLWANAAASLGGTQKPGDFGYVFLPTANAVIDRTPLYMNPGDFVGPPQAPYAYPPALAVALTPLTLLPEHVRGSFLPGIVFSLVLIASMTGGLLLLGVRDWRCYPIVLLWPVTLESIEYGAVGPLLVLLVAVAWRFRDSVPSGGAAIGGTVAVKLFLWPLVLWLGLTRRLLAAATAVGVSAVLVFGSWAVVGFDGLAEYPRLLRKLVQVEAENSYSALAMLETIGLTQTLSRILVALAGVALLVLAYRAAASTSWPSAERDRRSLTLVLAAGLVLTPILWLHYLVLLAVPIALARPRLSALWFVPLAMTLFEALGWYRGWPSGEGRSLVSVAVVVALVIGWSLLARPLPAEGARGAPARA
jgi:hypothetical protein